MIMTNKRAIPNRCRDLNFDLGPCESVMREVLTYFGVLHALSFAHGENHMTLDFGDAVCMPMSLV